MSFAAKVAGLNTTDAAFITAMCEVVAATPERIYQRPLSPDGFERSCAYVHTDDNGNLCDGCLIGTILVKMGVPREWFIDYEMNTLTTAAQVLTTLGFSPEVCLSAENAQVAQDMGNTWSVAADEFHRMHGERTEMRYVMDYSPN